MFPYLLSSILIRQSFPLSGFSPVILTKQLFMSVRPCLAENVCRCSFAFFAPSFPSSPAVCGADSRAAYTVSSLVAVWHHSQSTNDVPGRNPCRGGVLRFAVCCTCRVTGCGDCPVAERTVLYCTVLYYYCTVLYCTS